MKKNKIGLSLSFCIRDIIEGKVALDEVSHIEAGTRMPDVWALDRVINSYRKNYWRKDPDLAEEICRKFWAEGKIQQVRLEDDPETGRQKRPEYGGGEPWKKCD